MGTSSITLVHAFLVAASLNWATHMLITHGAYKLKLIWLAFLPAYVAPIYLGAKEAMMIALSVTTVLSAVALTVLVMRKKPMSNITKLCIQGAPYVAHCILGTLAAFSDDTNLHWTGIVATLASPLAVVGVLFFT